LSGNYGGGARQLALAGHARVDGTLSANGGQALGYYGAGSGGSIFLQCRRFSGSATGLVTAAGGNGDTRGGGGGGGRIAVLLGLSDTEADALLQEPPPRHLIITTNHVRFAGGINVSGGGPGSDKGGAGQTGHGLFCPADPRNAAVYPVVIAAR